LKQQVLVSVYNLLHTYPLCQLNSDVHNTTYIINYGRQTISHVLQASVLVNIHVYIMWWNLNIRCLI